MGLQQLTISMVLIGLFSIAIIGFAVNFASDNSTSISLSDDDLMSSLDTNIQSDINTLPSSAESTYQSIVESSIDEGETTPSGGQFTITPVNSLSVVKNIIEVGYIKIFGSGSGFGIFLSSFIAILSILFGFYVWKAWAGRSTE